MGFWSLRKLIFDAASSAFARTLMPYRMNFAVTKECHSRCKNCYIWKQVPQGELSLEEIERISVRYRHLSWISFTGGEPTDRKDLPEIVRVFQRHSKRLCLVNFSTNGIHQPRILDQVERILVGWGLTLPVAALFSALVYTVIGLVA
ncbi:MAG: radical SAM protein [Bdellovibrionales bacterium]|nr:radical SAM protein [Bdellovibrionales bacterium]